ncbi:MBL fold metallo-hydrolase [Streptomyces flavidovirens]|uniref:MBL fold metallo-hydrolase n=1 Tax=Streptomyces flavidovirens TaxID=67298 RepID=UPI0034365C9B
MAGTAAGLALGVGTGAASAATGEPRRPRRGGSDVSLRWLGVAGWELAFDGRRILVDPYLSRQEYRVPGGSAIDPDRRLEPDSSTIETIVGRHLPEAPELMLVTHGHFDHLLDVPHLLNRRQWHGNSIRTLCGETSWHLLRAMGTQRKRVDECLVVSSGEVLRFPAGPTAQPPAYTVEVFRSLHSQYGNHGFFAPGTLTDPPRHVRTLGDMREGGTLAYQVTVGDRLRVMFLSGTANLAERELEGARPDVLVLGVSGHAAVHRYVERAMEVLGRPPVVVPSHHDDMLTSLLSPNLPDSISKDAVTALHATVHPYGAQVLDPRHLHAMPL